MRCEVCQKTEVNHFFFSSIESVGFESSSSFSPDLNEVTLWPKDRIADGKRLPNNTSTMIATTASSRGPKKTASTGTTMILLQSHDPAKMAWIL